MGREEGVKERVELRRKMRGKGRVFIGVVKSSDATDMGGVEGCDFEI